MIIGVGTDIFLMSRLVITHEEDAFIQRAYTQNERDEASKRDNKHLYYATRFCAKEAVYKAISSINLEFKPSDIEILTDEKGKPYATIHGKTKKELDKLGNINIQVSISYDTDYAISFALAQKI